MTRIRVERPEVGDLVAHIGQMFFGDGTRLSARALALVRELEQRADLGDGKPSRRARRMKFKRSRCSVP